ncbi:MAG: hypothetical protein JNK18_15600 [Cyclobacteriaceae bacterium]|nr:hypothetical protein [Cyclobacteriaceae bacterium]
MRYAFAGTSLCVFALLSTGILAQDFSFIKFGQQEGLQHSQIVSISQDNTGNLWLGTITRSIYRFDGKLFSEYKINAGDRNATLYTFRVQADRHGNVWILSNLGLIHFDGKNSKIIPNKGKLICGSLSELFLDEHDHVWVTDQKGEVFTLRGDSLVLRKDIQRLLPRVFAHYISEKGEIHFLNRQGQILSGIERAEPMLTRGPWKTRMPIHSISQTGNNEFIVASTAGIERVDSTGSSLIPIPGMSNKDFINKIILDERGWVWGVMTGRLFVIDRDKVVHWIAATTDLKNDTYSLFQDRDKSIWLSVDAVGIAKYKQHAWQKIPSTVGVDITSIAKKPDGGLLFGTYHHGVIGYDKPVLPDVPITALHYSNTTLFIGTLRKGIFKTRRLTPTAVFPDKSVYLDVNGVTTHGDSIILATHRGLYVIEGSQAKFYGRKSQGFLVAVTTPIIVNGSIYVGGMVSGVLKLSGDSLMQVGPSRLRASTVYGIRKLPWNEYVVTGEFPELLFFDSAFNHMKSIHLDSYMSNVLLVEFIDRQHLIVASNDGLFKVILKGDSVERVKKYGKVDGFNGEEVYANASLSVSGQGIFIGTVNGAYQYQDKNELSDLSPPSTYLTQALFRAAKPVGPTSGLFQLFVNPKLNHHENYVTFQFSSTSLSNPYNTTFTYTMEGLDEGWSAPASSQIVSYSNLAPGNYKFKVQSISENKLMGTIAEYPFVIKPAFWQTSLFYVVIFMLAVVGVTGAIQMLATRRIYKLKVQEQMRIQESIRLKKQMSMDFHDEMGNRLANMLTQASLMKMTYAEGTLHSVFDFFEKHAHAIYHGTKDFIWSIDFESNNLKEVVSYLRDFGVDYFEKNGIKFHVQNEILSEAFNVTLPEGYNRNIILIMKEAMTNTLKHARARNLYFTVVNRNADYSIELQDDGVGLSEHAKGNGLRNMKSRAARINGQVVVTSRGVNGTVVVLSFKISRHEQF